MNTSIELKIADILSVARSQLVCCEVILEYPKKQGKNYDPGSVIDNFWMNTGKAFFYDSLSLTATLINKDPRTISFFNWQDFAQQYTSWLEQQVNNFENLQLKTIRDQVVSHVDISNRNNRLPRHRRQGSLNENLALNLRDVQEDLIEKFDEFTRNNTRPYSRSSFFEGDKARQQVEHALDAAKPELTSNPVGG